ncbi:MAG: hypothetical protein CMJ27_12430, partial [Phycisphaerae bacterium]
MALTPEHILNALRTVRDPDLGKDLVTLGMVKRHDVDGPRVMITVELTTPACPMKDKIQGDIEAAVHGAAREVGHPVDVIDVEFTADVRRPNEKARDESSPLPGVRQIIAVGAAFVPRPSSGSATPSRAARGLAVGPLVPPPTLS